MSKKSTPGSFARKHRRVKEERRGVDEKEGV